ncbi:CheY chemotaxis protein or a CheY-like REC (receiver) domain [Monaibacterium marinum]|uniref:CheY chemotaxis protein or a CheY-like REC (Receiver) domain n=1 Tax=Pontivivens marinum TaxID=1690039 RepID=A0A2C9CN55_9RHOB|nr:response regulator [Monaibacterium marinum]SOH92648.1 CheY chemotaxis protein or a CheY-like REC (receiver) domain [Monaibacterium marinum]
MRPNAPLKCPRVFSHSEQVLGAPLAVTLTGRRILIAEDEGLLALDMEFALIDAGATVLGPVIDVQDGLELLTANPDIDAAILDLDLRGNPVYPIADALRERGVPFVFHTGLGSTDDLHARYGNETRIFTKPSHMESVIGALVQMIPGPR